MAPKDPPEEERTMFARVKVAAPRVEGHHPCLHLQSPNGGTARAFVLQLENITIGRDPSADIVIDSPALSRRHAVIKRMGDQTLVFDTNSANGVYVNGVQVHSAALHDGDQLQLADVVLVFRGH